MLFVGVLEPLPHMRDKTPDVEQFHDKASHQNTRIPELNTAVHAFPTNCQV